MLKGARQEILPCDLERLALGVLRLELGANAPQLRRRVLQVVGEHELRVALSEGILWRERDRHTITDVAAFERLFDFGKQIRARAVDVGHRQVAILEDIALLVAQHVGERNNLVFGDDGGRHENDGR